MHIPDGFISGEINAAAFVVSAGVVGLAVVKAGKELSERQVPLIGVTAAFIFAAQMMNFPVAGGTSGHFLGATLAAVLLGPLSAVLIMAMVLLVQCLGFADGGLTALGTNIFNMGIIAGGGGYLIFRAIRALLPKTDTMFMTALFIASWISVVMASTACAVELAVSGISPLKLVMPAMVGVHILIGIGEGMITAAVVSMVLKFRPDLISALERVRLNASLKEGKFPVKSGL